MKAIDNANVIVILPAAKTLKGDRPWPRGSMMEVAKHAHVHLSTGECIKNRYATRCPK